MGWTFDEARHRHTSRFLTSLVEAAYARDKVGLLDQASRKVNSTRLLLRMAKDLKLMSIESYGFSAERLDEIGRMVPPTKATTEACSARYW